MKDKSKEQLPHEGFTLHREKDAETGGAILMASGEDCGVLVFEKDAHCAEREMKPALNAACLLKNILKIDDLLRTNQFGYDAKISTVDSGNL